MNANVQPTPIHILSMTLINAIDVDTSRCEVTLRISIDGVPRVLAFSSSEAGVGLVSGICGAFRDIVPNFTWKYYQVKAKEAGENAVAKVTVSLCDGPHIFNGDREHNNTLFATVLAIADALHKLRYHRWQKESKREPQHA